MQASGQHERRFGHPSSHGSRFRFLRDSVHVEIVREVTVQVLFTDVVPAVLPATLSFVGRREAVGVQTGKDVDLGVSQQPRHLGVGAVVVSQKLKCAEQIYQPT